MAPLSKAHKAKISAGLKAHHRSCRMAKMRVGRLRGAAARQSKE